MSAPVRIRYPYRVNYAHVISYSRRSSLPHSILSTHEEIFLLYPNTLEISCSHRYSIDLVVPDEHEVNPRYILSGDTGATGHTYGSIVTMMMHEISSGKRQHETHSIRENVWI